MSSKLAGRALECRKVAGAYAAMKELVMDGNGEGRCATRLRPLLITGGRGGAWERDPPLFSPPCVAYLHACVVLVIPGFKTGLFSVGWSGP